MNISIDRDVPLPIRRKHKAYPLELMQVGDSFRAEPNDRSRIYALFKSHPLKQFSIRTVREEGDAYIRVWRIR